MNFGRTGCILPGGGFRCAFQVGALQAIEENEIQFEKMHVSSGGATNGVKHVESGSRGLKAVWMNDVERYGPSSVFNSSKAGLLYHSWLGDPALYDDRGLWHLLNQVDMAAVVNSKTKLQVVVFNEMKNDLDVVCNHEFAGSPEQHQMFKRFVKASSSYPGIFNPEVIDGVPYSDGMGVRSEHMADLDTIFWIETNQPRQVGNPATLAAADRLMKQTSWLIDREIKDDIKENLRKFKKFPEEEKDDDQVPFWKQIGKLLTGGPENKRLILIRPTITIPTLTMRSFNPKTKDISRSIQHGYERTQEILLQLKVA